MKPTTNELRTEPKNARYMPKEQVRGENLAPNARKAMAKRRASRPKQPRPAPHLLHLEGSLSIKRPRSIIIQSIDPKHKQAQIALPIMEPTWDFYEYCHEVHVLAEDDEGNDLLLKTIPRSEILKHEDETMIRVEIELPDHSYWPILWYAVMKLTVHDGSTTLQETPRSMDQVVDMHLPEQRALIERKPALLSLARQSVGKLRALLHHMIKQGHLSLTLEELETRYWTWHRVITEARSNAVQLSKCLQLLQIHSCPELTKLLEVLEEAVAPKEDLEHVLEGKRKKDELKAFKGYIADKLEVGEAAEWIASVTEDGLIQLGGQSNRLYQLLVEGKKANSLAVDPVTLEAAASRTDFFSTKQCERLLKICDDAEELRAAEAARLLKAEKQRELEEATRREMEERAKLMPRGTTVKLKDFKQNPELNGALGVYMGVGEGQGRYVVRLLDTNKEVALLKDNFEKYELFGETTGRFPSPTTVCTYLDAAMSQSTVCQTESDVHAKSLPNSKPPEESQTPVPPLPQPVAALNAAARSNTRPTPGKAEKKLDLEEHTLPAFGVVDGLFEFLQTQQACFKRPVKEFYAWLKSEDIGSLDDLAEAVIDEDFLRSEMKPNGLKGFKRSAFQKTTFAAVRSSSSNGKQYLSQSGIPVDLECPISHTLMIDDPVVASDGIIYERVAIEQWFAKSMAESGVVRSPMNNEILADLSLTSVIGIRAMARAYAQANSGAI